MNMCGNIFIPLHYNLTVLVSENSAFEEEKSHKDSVILLSRLWKAGNMTMNDKDQTMHGWA